jgi:dTDP-4-amino-4,6-dideoxygalactose transaminase
MKIADKNKFFVVEDAAQALGSKFKGKHAGTFGDAAAISFFPAKVLGCLGDGGGVIANDDHVFDRIYQLHDHGRDQDGEVRSWGRNSRLDNFQAAILNYRFEKYDLVVQRRREIAALYEKYLSSLESLTLPPAPNADPDHFDIYQNYEMQAERRDELKSFLQKNGIGTLIQWGGKAVHQWERLGFNIRLPKVEKFFQHCIMLPMNMFITNDDVEYICTKIHEFYGIKSK